MIEKEQQNIITEHEKCGMLTEANRIKLVKLLCEYLYSKFGPYPTTENKIAVSLAITILFPCLKYVPSQGDGIVSIIVI